MSIKHYLSLFCVTVSLGLLGCSGSSSNSETSADGGGQNDTVRIVGSSTVFPFSTYVAQNFTESTDFGSPFVESTGSGGGHKTFGEGVGEGKIDITNSSRPMKASEFDRNVENGVDDITEAMIGYDGISVAQNKANADMDLTLEQLAMAVLKEVPKDGKLVPNPYNKWNEIDPSLPDREIIVMGPPTTSGTRDAFDELCLQAVTKNIDVYSEKYDEIRSDAGRYVPSGEDDNLIVKKLEGNKDALGIFGYSFLSENGDKISAVTIGGVSPTPDTISSGEYPLARSLFFYIKNAHRGKTKGLNEFIELFMSEKMIGDQGALKKEGLIPLAKDLRIASRKRVMGSSKLMKKDEDTLTNLQDYIAGNEK